MAQQGVPQRELDRGSDESLVTPVRMDEICTAHDHLASIYRTADQQFAAAIPFVRAGLDRGERCLYVAGQRSREEVLEAMLEYGIDVDEAVESGALSVHEPAEMYGEDEPFDGEAVIDALRSTVEAAAREGYDGFRITGELSWLLEADADLDRVLEYERSLNRFYADYDAVGLCQYDREAFPDEFLDGIIENHPHIAFDGTVGRNVFYAPPGERPDDVASTVDRKLRTIAERAETRSRLEYRDRGLTRLTTATRELLRADADEIHDCASDVVRDVLGAESAEVWLYDAETGDLEPTDGGRAAGADGSSDVDPRWGAFVDQECRTIELERDGAVGERSSAGGGVAVVPLGNHGVIRAASADPDAFDDVSMDLLRTIAANVEAAYDRADRERQLREQAGRLERLERINGVIRGVERGVVRADSREEIRRVVCAALARSDAYAFAWIGEPAFDDVVAPLEWAGADGAGDELAATIDAWSEPTPAARAADTGRAQLVADVATERSFDAWRSVALERGFRSCVSVPITYEDTVYSVLTAYTRDSAMTELDRDVLVELGELIGTAVHSAETETALGSPTVLELDLAVSDAETAPVRLAREIDCSVAVEGYVPGDEADHLFVRPADDRPERVEDAAADVVGIERCRRVSADDDRLELAVAGPTVAAAVVDRGGKLRSIGVDRTGIDATVELPPSADVRTVIGELRRTFPGTELVARRTRTRSGPDSVRSALAEDLTDRQRDVLRTAYLSGYFESPRRSTGQEVTASLGISQPTFAQHLRAAQRKLCESLFE
ncbi:GAF domain-containing protein [Natronococcus sp. JC468]|uniref:MEDS domain-containing protein n=1 Tax=Natronococcus sp. JC468 TaxID=1961921 RepID=UPI001439CFDF|nr:MEDS domain-containing protein [Natronococcus sp. JC468]NKE36806.1 GAF domain-containing protein [Natronococcus sp. JC468]